MSSTPFDATIDLAPHASMRALTVVFWLHMALLIGLLAALKPGPPMAGLATLLALSWILLRRHPVFGFGPLALVRMTWHQEGGWTLREAGGATHEATLAGHSVVHDWIIVLNFRLKENGRRSRALVGDELDEESFRRLRARLALRIS